MVIRLKTALNSESLSQLSISSGGLSLGIIWNQGNTLKSRKTRHRSHIHVGLWSWDLRTGPNQVHGSMFWKTITGTAMGSIQQNRTDISNEKSMTGQHLSGTAICNMYLFCGSASVRLLFRRGLCAWYLVQDGSERSVHCAASYLLATGTSRVQLIVVIVSCLLTSVWSCCSHSLGS